MNWEQYKKEIELIEKQNNVEHDLYNIIADMIRERKAFADVSLRDISGRQRTKSTQEKVFWGLRGFPDFVILDKMYEPKDGNTDREYLYGVIEAKFVDKSLCKKLSDIRQLWGHLLWFKKVIYTNGIVWKFYKIDDSDIKTIVKETSEKQLTYLQDESYFKLARKGIKYEEIDNILECIREKYNIDEFQKTEPFVLRDKTKWWSEKEWNELVKYLDEYDFR